MSIENEVEEELSDDAAIDATLKESYAKIKEANTEVVSEPAAISEPAITKSPVIEPTGERVRSEDGKFAKKEPTVGQEPIIPSTKKLAPTTWKAETRAKWDKLDPDVQDDILKREGDMENGWKELGGRSAQLKEWDTAITPYMATLQSMGITPQQATQRLLAVEHGLRHGTPQQKAAMVQKIIKDYGIQFEAQQEHEQVDPRLSAIDERFGRVEQYITQREMALHEQENRQLEELVDNFKKSNQYTDAVYEDMVVLIQGGLSKGKSPQQRLQDAYDKAKWGKAELQETLIAERLKGKQEEAARVTSEARKAAAVNIPAKGKVAASDPKGSEEDDIRAGVRKSGLFA